MSEKFFGTVRVSLSQPVALLLLALLFTACSGGSSTVSNTTEPTASTPAPASTPQASPIDSLEEALRYVRNGQYTYVWVISRKDGKPLDGEDSAFLRTNAPQVVDWVKADAEVRKIVGGTNFNFEEGNIEALRKRFVMEDYSAR